MTREEEINYINDILKYEKQANGEYNKLQSTKQEQFDSKPLPPTKQYATHPTYPVIKSDLKYNWKKNVFMPIIYGVAASIILIFISIMTGNDLGFLSTIISLGNYALWIYAIYGCVCYFTKFRKEKEADVERIKNTPEYRQQCEAIDKTFKDEQTKLDEAYNIQLAEYENNILPEYNKSLEIWTNVHNGKISILEKKYQHTINLLAKIYDECKLIPKQYRKIPILQYIADIINTSDYDTKSAIEIYDRHIQQQLEQARLHEQQIANQQAMIQNEHIMIQNQLLDEQNYIADKARREANVAAAVGMMQRRNTNKALKNVNNTLNDIKNKR